MCLCVFKCELLGKWLCIDYLGELADIYLFGVFMKMLKKAVDKLLYCFSMNKDNAYNPLCCGWNTAGTSLLNEDN